MSRSEPNERDRAIVIHPPLNGEAHAIADVIRENDITTVILPDPATLSRPVPSPTADAITRSLTKKTDRAVGVDAFRGFFLLLMTFAMAIPETAGVFPQWMYHMQYPPPGEFVDRAGIAWRDITFPAFLFTMCVAIPITNSLRLAKGMSYPGVLWTAARRFGLLFLYALIIGHVNPFWTHDYTKRGNLVAILGFLVLWPLFTRKPAKWDEEKFARIKMVGWLGAAAILFVLPRAYGMSFSMQRIDGIIQALAFVSLATTTIWLLTRNNTTARLAVMGGALAVKFGNDLPGPVQALFSRFNVPWLFEPWMIELLLIAIPGTMAGDMIVRWMRQQDGAARVQWSTRRLTTLALLCFSFAPIAVVGYYNRYVAGTAAAVAVAAAAGLLLVRHARTERELTLASLFHWAAFLLVAGAIVEPVGGGIKKDPQTLSYLVFMGGLSLALLMSAIIVTDVLKVGRRITRFFVEVGQNPLLAYVAFMLFFNHIAWLTGIAPFFQTSATAAIVGCVFFAALTGALTVAATRRKLFWRA
ncbi:MAG TPA: DUF5009 domain-containing protein [Longimicrobiales bacterium]